MRYAINPQLQIGETLVSDIQFDIHSRDDIPQLLRGLQYLYNDTKARDAILEQLGSVIIAETDPDTGRPGMSLWSILVLGVLRLGLNCDYDRVMELANDSVPPNMAPSEIMRRIKGRNARKLFEEFPELNKSQPFKTSDHNEHPKKLK